jgi:hypothetical protein
LVEKRLKLEPILEKLQYQKRKKNKAYESFAKAIYRYMSNHRIL